MEGEKNRDGVNPLNTVLCAKSQKQETKIIPAPIAITKPDKFYDDNNNRDKGVYQEGKFMSATNTVTLKATSSIVLLPRNGGVKTTPDAFVDNRKSVPNLDETTAPSRKEESTNGGPPRDVDLERVSQAAMKEAYVIDDEGSQREELKSSPSSHGGSNNNNHEVGCTSKKPNEESNDFLAGFIQKIPNATKQYHRELLLGLLLQSNSWELDGPQTQCLSTYTQNRIVGCSKRKRRMGEPKSGYGVDQNDSNYTTPDKLDCCPLSLVPMEINSILVAFRKSREATLDEKNPTTAESAVSSEHKSQEQEEQQQGKTPPPSIDSPKKLAPIDSEAGLRRKGYASRSLDVLERYVKKKFDSSDLVAAISLEPQNASFRACMAESKTLVPQADRTDFKSFSLFYNECSMAAIANWACDPAKDESDWQQMNPITTLDVPVASTIFRKCRHCNEFGHFEIECSKLVGGGKKFIELGETLNVQQLVRDCVEVDAENGNRNNEAYFCHVCESKNSGDTLLMCDGCDDLYHTACLDPPLESIPEGDWFCSVCEGYNSDVSSVVELEGCDGFVIEQRKKPKGGVPNPEPMGYATLSAASHGLSTGSSFTDIIGVAKFGDLLAEFPSGPPEKGLDDLQLQIGELCWAKRAHATKGKPGRDEWWPAVVKTIITDPRSLNGSDGGNSPFLVRLLCVSHANRVRATNVLPFWEYYKQLGSNMLSKHKFGRYFRRAVEDALGSLGFRSLQEADKKAEMMRRQPSARTLPIIKSTPDKSLHWLQAHRLKKDGYLFESLPDPKSQNEQSRRKLAEWDAAVSVAGKPKILGSIVAWLDLDKSQDSMVGEVLNIDDCQERALVRIMSDWRRCLQAPVRPNRISYHTSHSASVWIPIKNLFLVCNGPLESVKGGFANLTLHELKRIHSDDPGVEDAPGIDEDQIAARDEALTIDRAIDTNKEIARDEAPEVEGKSPVDHKDRVEVDFDATDRNEDDTKDYSVSASSTAQDDEEVEIKPQTTILPIDKVKVKETGKKRESPPQTNKERKEELKDGRSNVACNPVFRDLARRSSTEDNSDSDDTEDGEKDNGGADSDFIDSPPQSDANDDDDDLSGMDTEDDGDISEPPTKIQRLSTKRPRSNRKSQSAVDNDEQSEGSKSSRRSGHNNENIYLMTDSQLQARGIYHVENILDARKVRDKGANSSWEYLIKWRGFSIKDATWEPESNILNKNYLAKYRLQKLVDQIQETEELKDISSPTYKTWVALKKGLEKIETEPNLVLPKSNMKACPFCGTQFKSGSFGGHIGMHRVERNYKLLKEAARLLDSRMFNLVVNNESG